MVLWRGIARIGSGLAAVVSRQVTGIDCPKAQLAVLGWARDHGRLPAGPGRTFVPGAATGRTVPWPHCRGCGQLCVMRPTGTAPIPPTRP